MGKPIENPIGKDVLGNLYITQKLSAAKIDRKYNLYMKNARKQSSLPEMVGV